MGKTQVLRNRVYLNFDQIWLCKDFQREHSSKSREKHKGNNERSKVEQFKERFKANMGFLGFSGKWWNLADSGDSKMPYKINLELD